MRQYIKKSILLTLSILISIVANAYDFEVGGIYYNKDGNCAIVTSGDSKYSGDVSIPSTVNYGGMEYSVTSIGNSAFEECVVLTSVTIPNSVTSIGDQAFARCRGLTSVTIGNSVTSIGDYAFWECFNLTSVTIPNSVTSIGDYAFWQCSRLTSVSIGNSVTSIGNYAFDSCRRLTSVTIPNSVTSIGDRAFRNCSGLTSVTIGNSVTDIGGWAFENCSDLTSIKVESGNTTYDSRNDCNAIIETASNTLFAGCKNTVIPNSVTSIGERAFRNCSGLTSVTIPNSVTFIGEEAFSFCRGLTSIKVESGNPTYDSRNDCNAIIETASNRLVAGCKNTVIPNSVTSIGGHAFSGCDGLISVTIPNSVTSIGYQAFSFCSDLTSVTIGKSVTSIEASAFAYCSKLNSVISEIEIPFTIASSVFDSDTENNGQLTVPKGKKSVYESTDGWNEFSNIVEAISSYTLTIQSNSGGYVSYNGTNISATTKTFTIDEGSSATLTITPDSGYRLASLTVNGTDVTSGVTSNKYTISSVTSNTSVVATFEQIPVTTYSLSIQSGSGGSVSYDGTTITNSTKLFTVSEGASVMLTFTPNTGYYLSKLTVGGTDVTSKVSNNSYTISSISANTNVVATFSVITYTLSIQATGSGTVTYGSNTISNTTRNYSVNYGSSTTLTFTPNDGYYLSKLTVGGTDVTSKVSNNSYTLNNITQDTSVVATFAEIPITNYTLSIQSVGNGSVSYDGTSISATTKSFTVKEGTSATLSFTPDNGYYLSKLTVGGTDVTSKVSNNSYTISNISANTNMVATFSIITYTLSIQATGSGTVTYGSNTISNTTRNYSVDYGSSATLTFKASSGYELGNLTVGGVDVTTSIINNSYTVSNITSNTSVVATFYALASSFTSDGINYGVTSFDDLTLLVKSGNYSGHLVIPSMVTHDGKNWQVTGIESGAFKNCTGLISIVIPSTCSDIGTGIFEGCTGLAAVTWNPEKDLTGTMFGSITNPNLLLFTSSISYAPYGIRNVVVNGEASEITLTDATSGNNFYCPQAFKAKTISYTHDYSMITGRGNSQGWETIALPFDVTTITYKTDVKLKPFSSWTQGSSERPFWLYRLTQSGWTAEKQIKANTPYIISMPNNTAYQAGYNVSGQVTFSAENATVAATSAVNTSSNGSKQFVPNFLEQTSGGSIYAINANNALGSYAGSYTEGSVFTNSPARTVHPFEAYTNSANNAKAFIPIFDTTPTGISILLGEECSNFRIYSLAGQLVRDCRNTTYEEAIRGLAAGVYLVNGKKVAIH